MSTVIACTSGVFTFDISEYQSPQIPDPISHGKVSKSAFLLFRKSNVKSKGPVAQIVQRFSGNFRCA
ncbi:MAG TPA: hypothetical protein PK587_11660, partial [Syntrophales bacterium]|nr:hypothetical protein [Syntrophales bacterium]